MHRVTLNRSALRELGLGVNFRAFLNKLFGFLFHSNFERDFLTHTLFSRVLPHVFGNLHGTKMGTPHTAKMSRFSAFAWQGLVVEVASGLGIERDIELIFPAKFEARFGD